MVTSRHLFKYVLRLAVLVIFVFMAELSWADRYVDNGDDTVTDTQTKLIWQKTDDGVLRSWDDACQHCTAGWRIPRIDELRTIIDYTRYDPAIDPIFNCQLGTYWSGSPSIMPPDYGWYLYFRKGLVGWTSKTATYYVRCVRGGPYWSFGPSERLKIQNKDTVRDVYNNLVWQRSDDGIQRIWSKAQSYCGKLSMEGYPAGWRLPSVEELQTIIDYTTYDPAFPKKIFAGHSSAYWSNTNYSSRQNNHWGVQFDYGGVWWNKDDTLFYARCVHDVALPPSKYAISGTVITTTGGPLSEVTLTVSGAADKTTKTGDTGKYSFANLSAGAYIITPKKDQYTFTPGSIAVNIQGKDVTGQNFTGNQTGKLPLDSPYTWGAGVCASPSTQPPYPYGVHKGRDILASAGRKVYPVCGGSVVANNTNTESNPKKYPTKTDQYWNAVLIVKHNCNGQTVYGHYGHIKSSLKNNDPVDGKIIGYVRESYNWDVKKKIDIRTPNADHLHLGINTLKAVLSKWGIASEGTTCNAIQSEGWVEPKDYFDWQ